jgi:capsule polysaccharide export protein KpsE/RkpR
MKPQDNLLGVIRNLYKRRRFIIYTCIAAGVLTAGISLLFPNYYRSTTVFLAGSPDQANPQLLFSQGTREAGYYGTENDIDRILTLAESHELINFLVDSFRLYEHYKINKDRPKASFKVREEFLDHYEVKKTARDAIELSIEDTDRELAARMTNTARNKIDEIVQRLIKNTQQKNLVTYESAIQNQERNLKILSDSLIALRRKYSIFDPVTQGDLLTTELTSSETQLAQTQARLNIIQSNQINIRGRRDTIAKLQAQIAGLETKRDTLRNMMNSFNEGSPAINTISRMYFDANESLAETQEKYKQLLNVYTANIPSIILVEEGAVPVVKYRPRRSIIVIAAGFVAFFFSVLGVLVFDVYKGIDWKEVFKPEKG